MQTAVGLSSILKWYFTYFMQPHVLQ